jgi:hypothetical protein
MLSTAARSITILLLTAAQAIAAPKVSVREEPECAKQLCHFVSWAAGMDGSDAARITIEGITPKPITEIYFADYGPADASLVRDARGTWYVLLPFRIGHGTGPAVSAYLGVLRVGRSRLHLVRRLQVRYWTGFSSGAEYAPRVVAKPREGGLVIRLTRQVWGGAGDRDSPLPRRIKFLRVR